MNARPSVSYQDDSLVTKIHWGRVQVSKEDFESPRSKWSHIKVKSNSQTSNRRHSHVLDTMVCSESARTWLKSVRSCLTTRYRVNVQVTMVISDTHRSTPRQRGQVPPSYQIHIQVPKVKLQSLLLNQSHQGPIQFINFKCKSQRACLMTLVTIKEPQR